MQNKLFTIYNPIKKLIKKYTQPLNMKIGTHNGSFHCDQVLACTMLTNYVKKFKNAEIIRSRDPKILQTCDIVVDVGGKYNPPKILDHHQIEFQDVYPGHNVRMSSAGLVYLHFQEIIPNVIDQIMEQEGQRLGFVPKRSEAIEKYIRESVYKSFIIYIDANDNGVSKVADKQFAHVPTTLWSRISKANPMWWQQDVDQTQHFQKAMQIAKQQFYSQIKSRFLGSLQTKQLVRQYFLKRKQVHPSGHIVVLDRYMPWYKPIVELEEQFNCKGEILFVVFPTKNKEWRIQAVAVTEGSFDLRRGLKEQWRGIKDMEKLVALAKIPDIVFVHASGFIGGAASLKNTILIGELSL